MKSLNLFVFLFSLNSYASYLKGSIIENSEKSMNAPYVLLISIDGYRWDYTKKFKPNFLSKIKKNKATVKSLIPSYPTKTYPNHYTIVTGLTPEDHGIVANSFYDPKSAKSYSLKDRKAVEDGYFYGGIPLWNLAVMNQMNSATLFWPGSEAEINGLRPSYYLKYEHNMPHEKRLQYIYNWLKLPQKNRPHFLTLYFSDVDSAGHKYGTNSIELKNAIDKVDRSIQKLVTEIEKINLPMNIIITSDHGMTDLSSFKNINIVSSARIKQQLSMMKVVGSGPIIHIYGLNQKVDFEKLTDELNESLKQNCFHKKMFPNRYFASYNSRLGDIVCIAESGNSIFYNLKYTPLGGHGWPQFEGKDMHGIFYAFGPSFKENIEIDSVRNTEIYHLISRVLSLKNNHLKTHENLLLHQLLSKP